MQVRFLHTGSDRPDELYMSKLACFAWDLYVYSLLFHQNISPLLSKKERQVVGHLALMDIHFPF